MFIIYWKVATALNVLCFLKVPAVSIKLASGKQFDYETGTTTFIITCSADDGYRQTTASTTLLILDVNEAPYFRSVPVQVTVSEGPVRNILHRG